MAYSCREEGIRTLVTLLVLTRFPSVRLKPLGHLSIIYLQIYSSYDICVKYYDKYFEDSFLILSFANLLFRGVA